HRLVERCVDASVGLHFVEQAFAVGRTQLLDFAIAQEMVDDRVLSRELLERRRVGGVAGLRLLLRLKAKAIEQDLPQLQRGVHVAVLHPTSRSRRPATRDRRTAAGDLRAGSATRPGRAGTRRAWCRVAACGGPRPTVPGAPA